MAANNRRNSAQRPNVAFVRPELAKLIPSYELIRDCISGEQFIKALGKKYLPMPNAHDTSTENVERYNAYVKRAVFYNVTRRTLNGLCGQVFMRDPAMKLPTQLAPVESNATGTGVSLIQSAQLSLAHTLAYSRSGLFVDFTNTQGAGASADQVERGEVRPTLYAYSPLEIINWRVIEVGSKEVLSLVVLLESFPLADDGFEIKTAPQLRVLKLDEAGNYIQEIWRDPSQTNWDGVAVPKKGNFVLHETLRPTGANGEPLKEILFHFIGAQNNDIAPDNPSMYDIASINIAHYRNSADYEEACFVVGQPTVVMTGLTQEWVDNVLKGVVAFGSRGGLPLPVGGDAKLLQAEANTMIKEAMDTKEKQLVSLGAKLVEDKKVQRTAFETKVDAATEGSVLTSAAKNVSTAYLWALKWCASLMGTADTDIEFTLNTDFDIANMTPEELRAAIEYWQKGAITFEEMRNELRRGGVATEEDAAAKLAIAKDQVEEMTRAAENDPEFNKAPGDNVGNDK